MSLGRVLLVEDEVLIALDTEDVLTSAGYVVIGPAVDLAEAMAMADAEGLDAAVLDVNLRGVLSWPVAERLMQRGIPFVIMSGLSRADDVPAAFRHAPYVTKPARDAALLKAMASLSIKNID